MPSLKTKANSGSFNDPNLGIMGKPPVFQCGFDTSRISHESIGRNILFISSPSASLATLLLPFLLAHRSIGAKEYGRNLVQ